MTRERTATITEQLNNDPDLMNRMFDQLTKTFDDSEAQYESNAIDIDDDEFGVENVAEIDNNYEATGKKKETIGDKTKEESENNTKGKQEEDDAEDVNTPAVPEQKLNKKKGKKK